MRPRPIRLPEDTAPHDTVIEWWYFNGHLRGAGGERYAFMDCLFRADVDRVNIPYLKNVFARGRTGRYVLFAHSLLADLKAKNTAKDVQNISLGSRETFRRPLFYANYIDPLSVAGGFVAHEMAETAPGAFRIKTETMDLTLRSLRQPMLEGGNGFISVRGRESFYYSLTDMETSGIVRAGDAWVSVAGRSWMDHQWANAAYEKDKWTWFSVKLENGMDIMCVEYDDGAGKDHVVDILNANGRAEHVARAVFTPDGEIRKSKSTKAEYPTSWTVDIPDKGIQLKIKTAIPDGEMIFGSINYWEGPVSISAEIKGKTVKGVGFMELTGYPSSYNYLFLAGKKVNAHVQKEISARIKAFWR